MIFEGGQPPERFGPIVSWRRELQEEASCLVLTLTVTPSQTSSPPPHPVHMLGRSAHDRE